MIDGALLRAEPVDHRPRDPMNGDLPTKVPANDLNLGFSWHADPVSQDPFRAPGARHACGGNRRTRIVAGGSRPREGHARARVTSGVIRTGKLFARVLPFRHHGEWARVVGLP